MQAVQLQLSISTTTSCQAQCNHSPARQVLTACDSTPYHSSTVEQQEAGLDPSTVSHRPRLRPLTESRQQTLGNVCVERPKGTVLLSAKWQLVAHSWTACMIQVDKQPPEARSLTCITSCVETRSSGFRVFWAVIRAGGSV